MPRLKTQIFRPTPRNLARLAHLLRRGGLVALPTETVYGLAAHALDPRACRAIFTAKGRPTTDPLIVHVAHLRDVPALGELNPAARALAAAFWPGPLTLVLPKTAVVPAIVTAGLDTVAVRIPSHPLFRRVIRAAGCPLAAPSANPFGYISPTTAAHVRDGLDGRISSILDGGPCQIGVESTIVDVRDPARPVVLRPGGVPVADLRRVLKTPVTLLTQVVAANDAARAPGQLLRHYSPRTPTTLHSRLSDHLARTLPSTAAIITFQPRPNLPASLRPRHFILSPDGTGAGAAHHLFALLRDLDHRGFDRLHIELLPPRDPWSTAINDRLRRAAATS